MSMKRTDRLDIAGVVAPILRGRLHAEALYVAGEPPTRDRRPRPIKAVDAQGNVVRIVTDVALTESLLVRQKIELELSEEAAKGYCKDCGVKVGSRGRTPISGRCRPCASRASGAALTHEQRSELARRLRQMRAAQTPQQRSEGVRKANAAMTPEQRSARGRKGGLVPQSHEQRRESGRKGGLAIQSARTPEQRKEVARKMLAARTPEQISEIVLKMNAANAARRAKAGGS